MNSHIFSFARFGVPALAGIRSQQPKLSARIPAKAGTPNLVILLALLLALAPAHAQKWINPNFDAHRLDFRTLGYPDVTEIEADNSPITALVTARNGRVYGATSGKTASFLFLYDRAINKVRPLGRIGDARGVHHALVQVNDGSLLIGGGLNVLAPVPLTQKFQGGFRATEIQLWKDVCAPYTNYPGGHLYRYDADGDKTTRLTTELCPVEDLGIPVRGDSIYALALDAKARQLYGVSYPRARFFAFDLETRKSRDIGSPLDRQVYSGPERTWRSVPRALHVAPNGRVYTSGEDGRIVYFDPASQKLVTTTMQIPGEYWEAWNYHGYPVIEQWVTDAKGNLFGTTSDGYLFQMRAEREQIANLGKPRIHRRVRASVLGPDDRLYMICGEFEDACKLISYDTTGREGFRDWGVLTVDRSPYYAKRAYQFDAMTMGIDGTIFIGESDRRACLFLFFPGGKDFKGGFNPSNPR